MFLRIRHHLRMQKELPHYYATYQAHTALYASLYCCIWSISLLCGQSTVCATQNSHHLVAQQLPLQSALLNKTSPCCCRFHNSMQEGGIPSIFHAICTMGVSPRQLPKIDSLAARKNILHCLLHPLPFGRAFQACKTTLS